MSTVSRSGLVAAAFLIAVHACAEQAAPQAPAEPSSLSPSDSSSNALRSIRRICVDKISGPAQTADAVREMAFAALYSAKRFIVLENCSKADATLRGAVLENAERRSRSESEGIGFGAIVGGVSGGSGAIAGVGGSNGEGLSSAETRRQASVTLRLVNADGEIIWAYTQDSTGGKTKGPAADAIERAIRQLLKESQRSAAP